MQSGMSIIAAPPSPASLDEEMQVIKRNGTIEFVQFDKISNRIKKIGDENGIKINYTSLVVKVIDQLFSQITTTKIDELLAEQCAALSSTHYDYGVFAAHIIGSNHQKNTVASFSQTMKQLYDYRDHLGKHCPFVSPEFFAVVEQNAELFDNACDYSRDYLIDYFGFKTLERSYLLKINKKTVERIQHMWMRVAIGIHGANCEKALETYHLMSQKYFTHATPTLFNAGTNRQQLSSCFLIQMESDTIEGVFNTLSDCAKISKWSGGIGLHIHNIRAKGSLIRGTGGVSTGIVPMLKVFNNTAKYINQGGKRNGSFAIYLEPWHADVEAFLQMRKNHGDEELKARDLFYALWIPDLFMARVKAAGTWTLMCPDECQGLSDVYGEEFEALYTRYEREGKGRRTMAARDLWMQIMDAQMETGTPYLLYKDSVNKKSNQKNVGVIKSSNLCCEITEYSDANETAVCNLASLALPTFVNMETKTVDYVKLAEVCRIITRNLNNIIDINYYPTEKTRVSNMRHRPIGIGVQGLADVFMMLDLPFDCPESVKINRDIFETIYYGALDESCNLAVQDGKYETFDGSPASQGILQFDMWNVNPTDERHDWTALKRRIVEKGLRNSLLVAPMPTASTSQILGNNECIEPITSNIYSRGTLSGDFVLTNKYLMKDLIKLGLWNDKLKNNIIANHGSVQHLECIPAEIKNKFKTVWEIPMKSVINMAVDRGAFICQSQSLNLWVEDPNYNGLTSMHFYAWSKGLKTGIYYLRRRGRHEAQQFTVEPEQQEKPSGSFDHQEDDICEFCSA